MLPDKTRTRHMMVPLVNKSDTVKLGHYRIRGSVDQPWSEPTASQFYSVSALNYPGRKAKVTMDELHSGPPYRSGGLFRSLRIESCEPFQLVNGRGSYTRADGLRMYEGGFQPPSTLQFGSDFAPYVDYQSKLKLDNPDWLPPLGDWGDKAYNRLKPKLEKAGGGVFIGELRDMPRMLMTSGKSYKDIWQALSSNRGPEMLPKKAADHFINQEFGWNPFLNDLRKFLDVYQDSDNILKKLSDENGQWIRKRVTLHESVTNSIVAKGEGLQLFPNASFVTEPGWFTGIPHWTIEHEIVRTYSAVGKFRYYRPEFDRNSMYGYNTDPFGDLQRHLTIYGIRVSPSNLYKITPWTWAIDWVSNFGDYIDRVNDMAIDSIAAQYIYVMMHIHTRRVYKQYLPFGNRTINLEFTRTIEGKQRNEGLSPFGFNLDWTNLTARQILIAGALGITGSTMSGR